MCEVQEQDGRTDGSVSIRGFRTVRLTLEQKLRHCLETFLGGGGEVGRMPSQVPTKPGPDYNCVLRTRTLHVAPSLGSRRTLLSNNKNIVKQVKQPTATYTVLRSTYIIP